MRLRALACVLGCLTSWLLLQATPIAAEGAGTPVPLSDLYDMLLDPVHEYLFLTGSPDVDSTVVVADLEGEIVTEIDGLPGASGMVLDEEEGRLYVALYAAGAIAEIDIETLTEVARIPIGSKGECPRSLTTGAGLVWFGYGCGPELAGSGIGSLEPGTRQIHLYRGPEFGSDEHPPDLASAVWDERRLVVLADDILEFRIRAKGRPALYLSEPSAEMGYLPSFFEMVVDPVGELVYLGSLQRFRLHDLGLNGVYPLDVTAMAVALTAQGSFVAGGGDGIYEADIQVFPTESTQPAVVLELEQLVGDDFGVARHGLGFDPLATHLYVVAQHRLDESDLRLLVVPIDGISP